MASELLTYPLMHVKQVLSEKHLEQLLIVHKAAHCVPLAETLYPTAQKLHVVVLLQTRQLVMLVAQVGAQMVPLGV